MDLHFTGKIMGMRQITKENYVELVNEILGHLNQTRWAEKTENVLTILIKGFEERVLQGRIGGPAPIPYIETATVHLLNLETRPGSTRKILVKIQGDWVIFPPGEKAPAKMAQEVLSAPLTEAEVLDYAHRGYATNDGVWEKSRVLVRSWLGHRPLSP